MSTPAVSPYRSTDTPSKEPTAAPGRLFAPHLAIAGFTALGSSLSTPRSSRSPPRTPGVFREHQTAVTTWFLVLVLERGADGSRRDLLGRLAGGRLADGSPRRHRGRHGPGHRPAALGPARTRDRPGRSGPACPWTQRPASSCRHLVLGKVIGETIGYAFTAPSPSSWCWRCAAPSYRGGPQRSATPPQHSSRPGSPFSPHVAQQASPTSPVYVVWCAWLLVVAGLLLTPTTSNRDTAIEVCDRPSSTHIIEGSRRSFRGARSPGPGDQPAPQRGVAPSAAERTVRTGTRADPRPVVTSEGGPADGRFAAPWSRSATGPKKVDHWATARHRVCVCWTLGPGSCSAHTAIEVSADRTSSLLVKRRRHWSAPEVPALVTGRQRVDNQDAGWAVPPARSACARIRGLGLALGGGG